jgi:ABC-type amino acid transport substrate-binding protein
MKLNRLLSTTLLAATLATAPLLAPHAMAQEAEMGAEIAAQDGKIDAFIEAALAVSETRARYIAQLETVTDESAQMEIIQEADAAILDVVDATPDISIDEYIAIGEAAAADPDLAARIDARFAEAFSE